MKTTHKRPLARAIALAAVMAFAFMLPVFAGADDGDLFTHNGIYMGSFNISTYVSSSATVVSGLSGVYCSATVDTDYSFRNPAPPYNVLDARAYSYIPERTGSAYASTTAANAKSANHSIGSNWTPILAVSTHTGYASNRRGDVASMGVIPLES